MSDVKWTKEQMDAIKTKNCNLLVAAGAGSGKTAVLVERIINIITDTNNPVDIDKLLVVTFTNAAASEIRERIAEAILDKIKNNPNSNRLQRQLTLLNKASIATLHSFCLNVIKNNFNCVNIDPNFRISDETENILLKQEALDELFEDKYDKENNVDFLNTVEYYCSNRDDLNLQSIVLELYNFSSSFPWPEEWLKELVESFKIDDFKKIVNLYTKLVKDKLIYCKQIYETAVCIIDGEPSLEPYYVNFNEELAILNDCINSVESNWENFKFNINNAEFKSLKRCKKDVDKQKQEKVKNIRDNVKKQINSIKDELININYEIFKNENKVMYPIINELVNLVIQFKEKFEIKKRERGIIDFNDIEHLCLQILCNRDQNTKIIPTQIAFEVREKYDEILIDEYQDTNLIQETIINLIKRDEPNVFMVGDVKQSIYRFRQARPELFIQKYNTYSSEPNKNNRKILLYKNFRSRKEVISAVNYIFQNIMTKKVGELNYESEEYLNYGANYPECDDEYTKSNRNLEIDILDKKYEVTKDEDGQNDEESITDVQMEARIVAVKINQLIKNNFKVYDKRNKEYRNVKYSDIVVLLRSTQRYAPEFMDELKNNNIPVYADTGIGYFDTVEIKIMMSLLQIIDNPLQDIPLISILRCPIFSFTEDEIIYIRTLDKDTNVYNNLNLILSLKETKSIKSNIIDKVDNFLNKLNLWREKSITMELDEFIWYLYTSTGYYGYVGAMPGGIQRQANLRILFQRAKQYENTSYKGLFNFINFINKLRQSSGDMGTAKIVGENENVVRIMSIHKSKGLEFPVVIFSALGKKFNMKDLNSKILYHHDMGIGSDFVDIDKRITYTTITKQLIRHKIKLETLSEEMRLIYVAFTRAREKLILTGAVNDIAKSMEKWKYSLEIKDLKLPDYKLMEASCNLDWIIPAIIKNKDESIIDNMNEEIDIIEENFDCKIKLYKKNELKNDYNENIIENVDTLINQNTNNEEFDDNYYKIDSILKYDYPYKISTTIPTVITVTELKRRFNSTIIEGNSSNIIRPYLYEKPQFLINKKGLTSAEKGTALHSVMQRLSFDKVFSYNEIKSQIDEMVMKELITEIEAESININKILTFFNSPIGKRMLRADEVYREVPFHIELSSDEIDNSIKYKKYEDEKVILQGIIDCYFIEDGNVVLIDYKTDYVKDVKDIVRRYKIQIEYYSKVLEKIMKKTINEKYIYLFYNNMLVTL